MSIDLLLPTAKNSLFPYLFIVAVAAGEQERWPEAPELLNCFLVSGGHYSDVFSGNE